MDSGEYSFQGDIRWRLMTRKSIPLGSPSKHASWMVSRFPHWIKINVYKSHYKEKNRVFSERRTKNTHQINFSGRRKKKTVHNSINKHFLDTIALQYVNQSLSFSIHSFQRFYVGDTKLKFHDIICRVPQIMPRIWIHNSLLQIVYLVWE